DPFFMSVASDTDCWMFLTSRGGLTAGRIDAERSLFPYETVDKLQHGHFHTGPQTVIRLAGNLEEHWEPLNPHFDGSSRYVRNIYKSTLGNWIVFEETHVEWNLRFRYDWRACERFGWVRTVHVENLGEGRVQIDVLDGIRNILPFGAPLALYQSTSSLVDAYKQVDGDPASTLASFSLTSKILDRAEAAEELRTNLVWSAGLPKARRLFAASTPHEFKRGERLESEGILKGQPGNYYLTDTLSISPGSSAKWYYACNVGQSHTEVAALQRVLQSGVDLGKELEKELKEAGQNLRQNIASSDGLQLTGDERASSHHMANVLFNNMRGGVFFANDTVVTADFIDFLWTRNRTVHAKQQTELGKLAPTIPLSKIRAMAEASKDPQFLRLVMEYLPIGFGRRHGDPSRPWNRFAIHLKNEDGTPSLRYQGNWRDIFQNWEALAVSFPTFLSHFIAKFVNASTIDGFNPYRVTRDGIDWEVEEPDDPWSFIGYWGDHQIIYLLKFLEAQSRVFPEELREFLHRPLFSYAAVPYRIKGYDDIVADPKRTISFDDQLAETVASRESKLGTDGRLLQAKDGSVYLAPLLEKLLVPVLSKLSNFVPGGGIWLNTQRPEWNDANNALVGNGISMVTLGYLRRYVQFLLDELASLPQESIEISLEVKTWLSGLEKTYRAYGADMLAVHRNDTIRRDFLDAISGTFEQYRNAVYAKGFSGQEPCHVKDVVSFLSTVLPYLETTLEMNRREDGLYHAYNLLDVSPESSDAKIEHLYLMLEGQVSALSSGAVQPSEALAMLHKMEQSPLFTEREGSYLLYPERELSSFFDRNKVPSKEVEANPLLKRLLEDRNPALLVQDAAGTYRFNPDFSTTDDLDHALHALGQVKELQNLVETSADEVRELFELVFRHRSYTGRSGTMYGYEGLGCIYWHMVAKALLAVQEVAFKAWTDSDAPTANGLIEAYYRLRKGLGFEKTAEAFGAFPLDPYSHTPPQGGARQPGMTGQVKEEILTRFGELGVRVESGQICFAPWMLRESEFLTEPDVFECILFDGASSLVKLDKGSLGFTYGQVPIVYVKGETPRIRVVEHSGQTTEHEGTKCPPSVSQDVFARTGKTARIEVEIPAQLLR
ncbi:MAG: hypothetical protein HKN21_01110, partial [Candidatus Eisenbacteria bacterium]|nr:hypothetical protein [Candidatus Eisenbacteria bacterium]